MVPKTSVSLLTWFTEKCNIIVFIFYVHDLILYANSGRSSKVRRSSFDPPLISSVKTLYHITRAIDRECFRLLFRYQEFQVSAVNSASINPQRACVRGYS